MHNLLIILRVLWSSAEETHSSPGNQIHCHHQRRPWNSSLCCPTIRSWCRSCGPQQGGRPASAGRTADLRLGTVSDIHLIYVSWLKEQSVTTLTLGASPSSDVAGVVVGQDLTGGGEGTQLDVVVESSLGRQTQESNVPPGGQMTHKSVMCPLLSWMCQMFKHTQRGYM